MKTTLLALALLAGPTPSKVADILKAPAKYDGKTVFVKGKIARFKSKTSKAGHDYTLFDLVDGKDKLPVYLGNKTKETLKDGDTVTVTGKFAKERKVGDRTYKDEIDASQALNAAYGVGKSRA